MWDDVKRQAKSKHAQIVIMKSWNSFLRDFLLLSKYYKHAIAPHQLEQPYKIDLLKLKTFLLLKLTCQYELFISSTNLIKSKCLVTSFNLSMDESLKKYIFLKILENYWCDEFID